MTLPNDPPNITLSGVSAILSSVPPVGGKRGRLALQTKHFPKFTAIDCVDHDHAMSGGSLRAICFFFLFPQKE